MHSQPRVALMAIAVILSGCGTPATKTAPCKRPAELTAYAAPEYIVCTDARPVNADAKAARAVIDSLAVSLSD
jgi:uncharacterized protein YceK